MIPQTMYDSKNSLHAEYGRKTTYVKECMVSVHLLTSSLYAFLNSYSKLILQANMV